LLFRLNQARVTMRCRSLFLLNDLDDAFGFPSALPSRLAKSGGERLVMAKLVLDIGQLAGIRVEFYLVTMPHQRLAFPGHGIGKNNAHGPDGDGILGIQTLEQSSDDLLRCTDVVAVNVSGAEFILDKRAINEDVGDAFAPELRDQEGQVADESASPGGIPMRERRLWTVNEYRLRKSIERERIVAGREQPIGEVGW